MDVPYELGRIAGRLDGHDEEIGGMRGQIGEIHGMVGGIAAKQVRIEEKLDKVLGIEEKIDRMLGSGPQVALRGEQCATEPHTKTLVGQAMSLLKNPNFLHITYPAVGLVVLLWVLVAYTNREASDFLPGLKSPESSIRTKTEPRPTVGP